MTDSGQVKMGQLYGYDWRCMETFSWLWNFDICVSVPIENIFLLTHELLLIYMHYITYIHGHCIQLIITPVTFSNEVRKC